MTATDTPWWSTVQTFQALQVGSKCLSWGIFWMRVDEGPQHDLNPDLVLRVGAEFNVGFRETLS